MHVVADVMEFLQEMAPPELSEDWDNTGLLLGDPQRSVDSIMTCLTLTPDVATEALKSSVNLVVSHHPILFRAVQRITAETADGRMLLDMIARQVAVYSPHTSYDSASDGINRQLASLFKLSNVKPLRPNDDVPSIGAGRYGVLRKACSLKEFSTTVRDRLKIDAVQYVGDPEQLVKRVGVACGAAGEFLSDAATLGCDVLVTGETRFHTCLEARSNGIGLVLPGHYATERPAMESLAEKLQKKFSSAKVWASAAEADPLQWL